MTRTATPRDPGSTSSSASAVGGVGAEVDDQSLGLGRIGDMLLPIERAGRGETAWPRVRPRLAELLHQPLLAHDTAGLYIGAPAVAFVIAATNPDADPSAGLERTCTVLDTRIADLTSRRIGAAMGRIRRGERPLAREFDLFFGLTGLGAYWLRRDPRSAVFRDVLSYLVRVVDPLPDDPDRLPGWWTDRDPSGRRTSAFPHGHANLGMAHGIAGPLALLSLAAQAGTLVPGQLDAIGQICAKLDLVQCESDTRVWWPYWITSTDRFRVRAETAAPLRPSWCYGTPGLTRAQQLAGIALRDTARQRLTEHALLACVTDPHQLDQIRDAGLCHGYAGVLHTVARAAADAPPGTFDTALHALRERVRATPAEVPTGLLDGAPGRELALLTATTRATASGWDTCLLTG